MPYIFILFILFSLEKGEIIKLHPILTIVIFITLIFINPLLIGISASYLYKIKIGKKLKELFGFNSFSLGISCWDYIFCKQEACWVLVTLKDNSQVAGKFQNGSKATLTSKENFGKGLDIFISEVYKINDDGVWQELNKPASIWISGDEIKYIEFWKSEEDNERSLDA